MLYRSAPVPLRRWCSLAVVFGGRVLCGHGKRANGLAGSWSASASLQHRLRLRLLRRRVCRWRRPGSSTGSSRDVERPMRDLSTRPSLYGFASPCLSTIDLYDWSKYHHQRWDIVLQLQRGRSLCQFRTLAAGLSIGSVCRPAGEVQCWRSGAGRVRRGRRPYVADCGSWDLSERLRSRLRK